GKAIVSTPYLHAIEALADDRGIIVPFRDAPAIADAVERILGDAELKQRLERRAYAYGRETAWPAVGRRVLALTQHVLEPHRQHDPLVAVCSSPNGPTWVRASRRIRSPARTTRRHRRRRPRSSACSTRRPRWSMTRSCSSSG